MAEYVLILMLSAHKRGYWSAATRIIVLTSERCSSDCDGDDNADVEIKSIANW